MHEFCPDEAGVCAHGKDQECPAMQPVPDGPKSGYCQTCGQYPSIPATHHPEPMVLAEAVREACAECVAPGGDRENIRALDLGRIVEGK